MTGQFEVRGQEFVELSRLRWRHRAGGARSLTGSDLDKVLAFGDGHGQTRYRF